MKLTWKRPLDRDQPSSYATSPLPGRPQIRSARVTASSTATVTSDASRAIGALPAARVVGADGRVDSCTLATSARAAAGAPNAASARGRTIIWRLGRGAQAVTGEDVPSRVGQNESAPALRCIGPGIAPGSRRGRCSALAEAGGGRPGPHLDSRPQSDANSEPDANTNPDADPGALPSSSTG